MQHGKPSNFTPWLENHMAPAQNLHFTLSMILPYCEVTFYWETQQCTSILSEYITDFYGWKTIWYPHSVYILHDLWSYLTVRGLSTERPNNAHASWVNISQISNQLIGSVRCEYGVCDKPCLMNNKLPIRICNSVEKKYKQVLMVLEWRFKTIVAGKNFCWKSFCTNVVRGLCTAHNSPIHSNGVVNYAIAIRLFRKVLRDRLKNLSRYNIVSIREYMVFSCFAVCTGE